MVIRGMALHRLQQGPVSVDADTAAALLDVLIARAPKLREAGVVRVELEDLRFDLLPGAAVPVRPLNGGRREHDDEPDDEATDAMHHPATYGRASGVPGFERPRRREENDE